MDSDTQMKIEQTVLEILRNSNMDETTEFQIRESASEMLGMDLSERPRKMFVREVVESYLREQMAKAEEEEKKEEEKEEEKEEDKVEEEEQEEEEEKSHKVKGAKEYDDNGSLIIVRLSGKRMVTLSEFKGRTFVSIREYYQKDGKELPSNKGISLTPEQWALFKNNIPEIEKAIRKIESR